MDMSWLLSLKGNYPDPTVFYGKSMSSEESRTFVSLWLSEGIPFIFSGCPAAYQIARDRLAQRLGISFRDIGLVGSSRLGYSLSPHHFGRKHQGIDSDLDLFAVSDELFGRMKEDAVSFIEKFESQELLPRDDFEQKFWVFNTSIGLPRNIRNGFINDFYVPVRAIFPTRRRTQNATFHFVRDANNLVGREIFDKCSLRIYNSWDAAIRQISFNVRKAVTASNDMTL